MIVMLPAAAKGLKVENYIQCKVLKTNRFCCLSVPEMQCLTPLLITSTRALKKKIKANMQFHFESCCKDFLSDHLVVRI